MSVLKRLEELSKGHLTPIPWHESETDNGCAVHDPEGLTLAYRYPVLICQNPEDLRLIVAMRNALPDLLPVVRAAEPFTDCDADGYHVKPPCGHCNGCNLRAALEALTKEDSE